ncbi:MAG: asparagine synthase (glutamine-hydrolyzing) [Candidatus Omnitrophica bacterium]|nr:asparagine synthase (glutamine-hydrolyzing) [Candidatus Omnitrophota bacterium]
MCGIVGFWQRDKDNAAAAVIERMVDSMAHRGPDDRGTFLHEDLALGHTRLSIMDLSERGHQPFVTGDGLGVLVFNGEIYNFRELKERLIAEGVSFKSTSDTEVLLYALHRWGPQTAVPQLDGIFAFAYYDRRAGTLWLARDRVGVKPLYWSRRSGRVVFSSEIKALFLHPDVPKCCDTHAVTTQAVFLRLDGDWTPYEGVECVTPGSLTQITREDISTEIYYDLFRDLDVPRILDNARRPFADQLAEFEAIFRATVERQLISDAPVAVMCSGGVDSSYVTAIAAEYKPDLTAYVADLSGAGIHEAVKAQAVADKAGIELRKVPIDQERYLRFWPKAIYANDQPIFFHQNVMWMIVSSVVHDDGFKVLLAGEGSDEVFGGYRWQKSAHDMWRERRFQKAWWVNNKVSRKVAALLDPFLPKDSSTWDKHPFFRQPLESNILNSDAALAPIDGLQRRLRQREIYQKLHMIQPEAERAFLARGVDDFYTHLRTCLLSSDKMGMAVAIETRVPFLANAVIDFGYHLNFAAKWRGEEQKYIVRQASLKKIPRDNVYAPKIGFGCSHDFWSKGADFIRDGMFAEAMKWDRAAQDAVIESLTTDTYRLHVYIGIEMWYQMFFNGQSPEQMSERLLAQLR